MIICHPLKLIFIKTKKTAGTSFEIALSRFCGPECVITPISNVDENLRKDRTGKTAQNHAAQVWPDGSETHSNFYNHIPAAEVRRMVPAKIWDNYRKITIVRDPFDAAISRYWWEGGDKTGLDFGTFVDAARVLLGENDIIAPLDGSVELDDYLRYENLSAEIETLKIDGLGKEFSGLRAKSNQRPDKGAGVSETYATFPKAADIVADECAHLLQRFGYSKPVTAVASVGDGTDEQVIFTLSAGRTGTAWLARLLDDNLDLKSIHEPLLPSDFGTEMPDIRTMREFNSYGITRNVRDFWSKKLGSISGGYAESNHTLGKCGLIETLALHPLAERTKVVVLRRDIVDQCSSYIARGDFNNVTLEWQWYLSPQYRNVMVDPSAFLPRGAVGRALWYCFEMEARYAYYKQLFGTRIQFVETTLEEVSTLNGAQEFLSNFGHTGPVSLPERANATADQAGLENLKKEIRKIVETIQFDPAKIAESYIRNGKKLALI
ncbi:sulfotransferase family protein [Shimia isoporae]|uniref:Sulfotransferase family protein n=1 Tax=Shimia isoporae TaxID=647720 RepID=A0A4R1NKR3_9RHOB|nr:sulfotransferase family 2 domain-containing protein [Shimia isoporae]TCL08824.1 sulfotransferase family protein [Shimia isoporae]